MKSSSMIVRLTREFAFETAHALDGYDGPCRNIHGHSYVLGVTVAGKPMEEHGHPKNGMVMDFSDLKHLVHEHIVSKVDHALVLNGQSQQRPLDELERQFGKIVRAPFQPTCENLLLDFVNVLRDILPSHIQLVRVQLRETAGAYAEWHQCDNP